MALNSLFCADVPLSCYSLTVLNVTSTIATGSTDHYYAVSDSPRKLKRRCDELQQQLNNAKRALEARAKSTVSSLLCEVDTFETNSTEVRAMVSSFSHLPLHLFTENTCAYSEEQRQFATTLHFYSPKAYKFCRKQLPLPAPNTLMKWLSVTDGRPGFSEQVFSFLRKHVEEGSWQHKTCSVINQLIFIVA